MPRLFRSLLPPVLIVLALLTVHSTRANNITTSTGSLVGNTGTQVFVQFNVTWANSWRLNPDRWDAAWLFVKYRTADGIWRHCSLENTGHTAPSGSTITAGLLTPGTAFNISTNPGVGAFIHRSAEGSGTFTANSVQLLWNYSANGTSLADVMEVRVYAIEMVYVPQGAFAAGSGGTESGAFTLTTINTGTANTAPAGVGSLGGQAGGYATGQPIPLTATYPNGFNASYCMKYEVSQQGYVDFLNTLTFSQQLTRTANVPSSAAGTAALNNANRNGIDIQTPGVAISTPAVYACNLDGDVTYGEVGVDGTDIACNWLSWGDLTAYLDWSGLRPMTEYEFEKACRGTIVPVANAFAWGNGTIASVAYTLAGSGANTEGIATNYSTTVGNASLANTTGAIGGPLRVGIFAANGSNSGRVSAGASYYGIMELSGNVHERAVIANQSNYTGTHGDGLLATNGDPNPATWPTPASPPFTRGGYYGGIPSELFVSDRSGGPGAIPGRASYLGGRGVRTAP